MAIKEIPSSHCFSMSSKSISSDNLLVNTKIDKTIDAIDFYIQINLYRIIQEFCNNSIKYSGADHINIQIGEKNAGFEVTASDNGSGFDINQKENQRGPETGGI